jgi:hypothetical protein
MQLLDEDYRLWIQGIGREREKIQSSGRKVVFAALARVLRSSLQFFDASSVCLGPL